MKDLMVVLAGKVREALLECSGGLAWTARVVGATRLEQGKFHYRVVVKGFHATKTYDVCVEVKCCGV